MTGIAWHKQFAQQMQCKIHYADIVTYKLLFSFFDRME